MRQLVIFALLYPTFLVGQNPPSGVTAVSATRASVQLQWPTNPSATDGYQVERQTLGVSDFTAIGTVTSPTITDNGINGEATYLYQVRSIASGKTSQPSNIVTVGPPSFGYNVPAPAPASVGGQDQGSFGVDYVMCLDGNGDPAIAYEWIDAKNRGDLTTTTLYFMAWSRAQYKWLGPVQVALTGDDFPNGSIVNLSLACDKTNGVFGIAYTTGDFNEAVSYAFSTNGGQTWKAQPITNNSAVQYWGPRLALNNGTAYFAVIGLGQITYYTGAQNGDPSKWTSKMVPSIANDARAWFDLKLDSAGNPGIAFWMSGDDATSILGFWRPSFANTVKVSDTNGTQNDSIGASLSFVGTSPRIGVSADRSEPVPDTLDSYDTYVVSAKDTGLVWEPMTAIPVDGGAYQCCRVSLAAGSRNQGAFLMETNGGYGIPSNCGNPKLAVSSDFVHWTTCAPSGPTGPQLETDQPTAAYNQADHLYLAFRNSNATDISPGLLVWRQPPDGAPVPPHINDGGVVDGATFRSPVVPGSIATIFGTNFIAAATGAPSTPLPQALGGVTVLVNGVPVPLIYVGLNQINFQMPYEVTGSSAKVTVVSGQQPSNSVDANISAVGPTIFVYGANLAAAQNPDGSPAGGEEPVHVGGYIVLYATGCGAVSPAVPTGLAAAVNPLSVCNANVTATVGGKPASVSFAGLTPNFVGLVQVNLQIPSLPNGSYPIQIAANGVKSNIPTINVVQ